MSGDPLAFLLSLERLGMKFGLENISRLCQALAHPERAFDSVVVAGTNGKGSVTAMVHAGLRAAGHHAARYTSPHLVRLEERFVVGDDEVSREALTRAAGRVQHIVERLMDDGTFESPPTFFECTTAAAFELFRAAGVRVAVLEVGLGGRLDATNVASPLVAAITSIDFDHQAQLGDSLESIAREKAGIARPGIPLVCGPLPAAAERVVARVCAATGATLVRTSDRVACTVQHLGPESMVTLRSAERRLDGVRLALPGRHQVDNAATAFVVLEELNGRGYVVDSEAIRAGLSTARWPARLERFRYGHAEVLLDAAHNPAGARALAQYLRDVGWTPVTIVFGAMRDKDAAGMLQALLPACRRLICTTAPAPRALEADALARVAAGLAPHPAIEAISAPRAALERACAQDSRIVAAGSIFLVGPLRVILRPDAHS
ncbi:MAG TPA: folylpolyglutamate synthase/dihydrofolate synthase family protein [Vicinamibacterales bacterium]|nr:folylpolyglutamate synthase/dihydrofolate synthase family protein [Vicinamibacterales bacterium]